MTFWNFDCRKIHKVWLTKLFLVDVPVMDRISNVKHNNIVINKDVFKTGVGKKKDV